MKINIAKKNKTLLPFFLILVFVIVKHVVLLKFPLVYLKVDQFALEMIYPIGWSLMNDNNLYTKTNLFQFE